VRKIAFLAIAVACGPISQAVSLNYTGWVGTADSVYARDGYSGNNANDYSRFTWGRQMNAGLIDFTVDGIQHHGFCLSPDQYINLDGWTADVKYGNDYIGHLLDVAINHMPTLDADHQKLWYAAAQGAIWEALSWYDPTKFSASAAYLNDTATVGTFGAGNYDWLGYNISGDAKQYLSAFGYDTNYGAYSYGISEAKMNQIRATYTMYIPNDPQHRSQILAEPSVPGPAAVLPFAIGLLASMKRRRK